MQPLNISTFHIVGRTCLLRHRTGRSFIQPFRFDGVRFGYRCSGPKDLEDLYKRSRGEGFGDEVKRRIMVGAYALSAGYYDAYYVRRHKSTSPHQE